jgi:hypothetical protein
MPAAAYDVLIDGLEIAVGDGPAFKPRKGKVSPKNEYEDLCLQTAIEHGYVRPPGAAEPSEEEKP